MAVAGCAEPGVGEGFPATTDAIAALATASLIWNTRQTSRRTRSSEMPPYWAAAWHTRSRTSFLRPGDIARNSC